MCLDLFKPWFPQESKGSNKSPFRVVGGLNDAECIISGSSRNGRFLLILQSPEITEQIDLGTHSTSELLWQGMWADASCDSVGKGAGGAGAGVVPCVSVSFHILLAQEKRKRTATTCVALGEFPLSLSTAVFTVFLPSGREGIQHLTTYLTL